MAMAGYVGCGDRCPIQWVPEALYRCPLQRFAERQWQLVFIKASGEGRVAPRAIYAGPWSYAVGCIWMKQI
jgi:hypothetical protein